MSAPCEVNGPDEAGEDDRLLVEWGALTMSLPFDRRFGG
jgi:hypothetical protein